jgi:P-type Mg2+ transporter
MQTISGPDLAKLEGTDEFDIMVGHCKVFAKLIPNHRGQVITSLKNAGEVVGDAR